MRPVVLTLVTLASSCLLSPAGQAAEQRLWKDATGKFQIQAVLVEQTATSVRLKTTDGREISVPVQRLSQADQDYLKSLSRPAEQRSIGEGSQPATSQPAGAPGGLRAAPESPSAGEEMALPAEGIALDVASAPPSRPFVPDPQPDRPALPSTVVPICAVDPYDKVSGPVPAGEGHFLIAIGRNKAGKAEETRGRIYSVQWKERKSDLAWDHPRAVRVWDHDPASGRTLMVDNLDQFQRGGHLAMVEGLGRGKATTLYRRTLPGAGKPGFAPQVEWARLLSGSHAAAIVDRVLYVWDLAAAKLVYRVAQASATEPPVLSANQVFMAIPQSGRVLVVETANGAVCRSIDTGSLLTPGVAFNRSGRLLAICFSNQYMVWDCVADRPVCQATTTDHLGSHPIHWIAPKMFRGALGDAIHLDLGMSVWKYITSPNTEPILVANALVTATTSRECTLVCAEIPHASAQKSVGQLMQAGDAAMLVRPGSAVAMAVETTEQVDREAILAALSEAAEKAGWKVTDRAPITLVAKIGRGKTRQLEYSSIGVGPRTTSTASITPFTAELEIRSGQDVLWTRASINHVPMLLHLKEGQTVQDAVKQYERPDPGFFSRLELPPRIPKPEIKSQVGMSTLKDGQWQDLKINPPARPRIPGNRPPIGRGPRHEA